MKSKIFSLFVLVVTLLAMLFIACPPADNGGDDDGGTTTTVAPVMCTLTFYPDKAGGQDSTDDLAEAQNGADFISFHSGTDVSQKFDNALSTASDDSFDVYFFAEPATAISDVIQTGWGTDAAKATMVGTGAARKYELTFDLAKANLEKWGDVANVNTKIAITVPNPTDLNTDKFYSMPPGMPNIYFETASITTTAIKGKYSGEAADWGIPEDTVFNYVDIKKSSE